jgi:opacity protein-like surface antigen
MAVRKLVITSIVALMVVAAAPSKASADWVFTPFIGATFGGSATFAGGGEDFKNDFDRNFTYGGSLAGMGGGAVGLEIDFGYTPNFYRPSSNTDGISLVGDGNVTTLMANLIIGAPAGPVRPYVAGGVGLIKSKVDDAGQFFTQVSSNDFGFDLGGGLMGFFSPNVGLRGDIRYFRSLRNDDPEGVDLSLGDFRFWRGTVGVSFKF